MKNKSLRRCKSIYIDVAILKRVYRLFIMKISEIQSVPREELNAKITAIVSSEAKRSLDLIAEAKGRTLSEVVREIVNGFLANNTDELQKLG